MATHIISTTLQLLNGTAAAWTSENRVLPKGMPGYEQDTGLLKIGDGVTAWNSLKYVAAKNDSSGNIISATYLPKTGGEVPGNITASSFQTGTAEANYFQCRKFRGEGDADTYLHAIDFGYASHNQVDFYEYGGIWNFWKNTSSTTGGTLVGSINENGWNGNVVGNVTGNAATATNATNDKNGKPIDSTYMPISSVSSYANIDYLFNPNKIFGSTFDGVNSTGTRTDNSVGLSFSPSSDIVEGTDDFRDFDPFNVIEVLTKPNSNGGSDIIAYQGDGLFDKYKDDDEFGADVLVGFPKGYMYNYIDSNNIITKKVSSSYQDGYIASPMHLRNNKLHNYVYLTKYGWCDDGHGGICSRPGHPQKVNTTESQFETLSRAKGFRVMGINEVSWLQHLGCIKYNSLNWQNTVGQGISATYVDKIATVTETGVTRIILSNADAASFAVGNYVLLSLNMFLYYTISSITTYDANNMAINLNTTTTFNTKASSTHISLAPAYSGGCDTILGQDGEISTGTSTKRSVLTFNLENLYGNTWKILSGIVLPDNNTVYLNPNPDDNYTWPSSATDAVNRGWTKYNISIPQSNGYISTFGYDPTYPYLSIPTTVSETASFNNPVGDYFYTTTFTSPHCAIFGGFLNNGAANGTFCLNVSNGVTLSSWSPSAFGVYVPDM